MSEATTQITLELVDKLSKGLDEVNAKLDTIGTHAKTAEKSSSSLSNSLRSLAQIAGLAFISKSLFDIGKSALKTAADFEQYNVAFKTMLGSASEATKLLNQIKNFAATTPFEMQELVVVSKQLLAFNFAAKDIIPTLTTLGNIAAGVGKPVSQLAYVFGQVKLAGRLMGQDLMQFTNAGVPLLSELAKAFNVSEAEIKKMVEQGKIGFPAVQAALESMAGAGGKFNNLMIAQSKTLSGVFSNITDNITQIGLEIGNSMLPIAKIIAVNLMGALDTVRRWFQDNQESIKAFFLNLAAVMLTLGQIVLELGKFLWTWVISPLIEFMKLPVVQVVLGIVAAYYAWVGATYAVAAASAALAAINPLGWIVIGVAAAVVAFNALTKHWAEVVNFIVSGIKLFVNVWANAIDLLVKLFTGNFAGAINKVVNGIKNVFSMFGKNKESLTKQASDLTNAPDTPTLTAPTLKDPNTGKLATTTPSKKEAVVPVTYKTVLSEIVGTEKAVQAFAKIGQAFRDYVVDGIMKGTLTIEGIWDNFTQSLYKRILEKLFNPIGAAMGVLANSIMTIFDQTLGQLIMPVINFVAQMIVQFAMGLLNVQGLFALFGTWFTGFATFLGVVWKALTNNMVINWIAGMLKMLVSLIATVGGAIFAFALLAASAAASAVALIPFVGPFLAPVAYAATFGLVIAGVAQLASIAVGLAKGTPNVIGGNSGDTVPAMLTPGEMVVPKSMAQGVRDGEVTLGGNGGGQTITNIVNVNLDGAVFNGNPSDELVLSIGRKMADAIKSSLMAPLPTGA